MDESQLRATPDEFGGKDKQMVVVEEVAKGASPLGKKEKKRKESSWIHVRSHLILIYPNNAHTRTYVHATRPRKGRLRQWLIAR